MEQTGMFQREERHVPLHTGRSEINVATIKKHLYNKKITPLHHLHETGKNL
jgi:hypothetical protein